MRPRRSRALLEARPAKMGGGGGGAHDFHASGAGGRVPVWGENIAHEQDCL